MCGGGGGKAGLPYLAQQVMTLSAREEEMQPYKLLRQQSKHDTINKQLPCHKLLNCTDL